MRERYTEIHLGSDVYASYDGCRFYLKKREGTVDHRITLDDTLIANFLEFIRTSKISNPLKEPNDEDK